MYRCRDSSKKSGRKEKTLVRFLVYEIIMKESLNQLQKEAF